MPMSAARSITLPSEVIMQPKPTLVTFSPVLRRGCGSAVAVRRSRRAAEQACFWSSADERAADAAAGTASPASRKLRRDESGIDILLIRC
jgi:hypothetical protein